MHRNARSLGIAASIAIALLAAPRSSELRRNRRVADGSPEPADGAAGREGL